MILSKPPESTCHSRQIPLIPRIPLAHSSAAGPWLWVCACARSPAGPPEPVAANIRVPSARRSGHRRGVKAGSWAPLFDLIRLPVILNLPMEAVAALQGRVKIADICLICSAPARRRLTRDTSSVAETPRIHGSVSSSLSPVSFQGSTGSL
ncbi:hypothetical protein AAFF_G00035520 [Aldrovandia affinis]|uniref:Uncharacterized protein n=1 Tax=Aldrovandia affinis TaxID=143900 RepID=A0AAD7WFE4_9TELE|nr:hypothetical protein AAFF_G00035520 [Aldrovandia affinis]